MSEQANSNKTVKIEKLDTLLLNPGEESEPPAEQQVEPETARVSSPQKCKVYHPHPADKNLEAEYESDTEEHVSAKKN